MGFSETGKPKFVDNKDKASYEELLSLLKEKNHSQFLMEIKLKPLKLTTEKQEKLWLALKLLINSESGNDLKTIEETLNKTDKEVSEMNNKEFNDLKEYTLSVCEEFFNTEIHINEYGNFQIKK